MLAHGAVSEAADLARVAVGSDEPAFNARPVHETHRAATLARRPEPLHGRRLVTDATDWTHARHTEHDDSTTYLMTTTRHDTIRYDKLYSRAPKSRLRDSRIYRTEQKIQKKVIKSTKNRVTREKKRSG